MWGEQGPTLLPLAGPGQQALLCPQTLSGPDLELHASNTTFLSTNASQGTLLPAHSGLSLIISDMGPDNSSQAPVVSLEAAPPLLAPALTHPLGLTWSPHRSQEQLWLAMSLCGTSWPSTASSTLWPAPSWHPHSL